MCVWERRWRRWLTGGGGVRMTRTYDPVMTIEFSFSSDNNGDDEEEATRVRLGPTLKVGNVSQRYSGALGDRELLCLPQSSEVVKRAPTEAPDPHHKAAALRFHERPSYFSPGSGVSRLSGSLIKLVTRELRQQMCHSFSSALRAD
jgi:hypothetical protein